MFQEIKPEVTLINNEDHISAEALGGAMERLTQVHPSSADAMADRIEVRRWTSPLSAGDQSSHRKACFQLERPKEQRADSLRNRFHRPPSALRSGGTPRSCQLCLQLRTR